MITLSIIIYRVLAAKKLAQNVLKTNICNEKFKALKKIESK